MLSHVIDILLHKWNGHPFDWRFIGSAAAATGFGGVLVGVTDKEWKNVHTVTSHGEGDSVSKRIALLYHHWIIPNAVCHYLKYC